MPINEVLQRVTQRIESRSAQTRSAYLRRLKEEKLQHSSVTARSRVGCTNLAHAMAAAPAEDKLRIRAQRSPHLAIVSSYNEMLSAHQPLGAYPAWLREAALQAGATVQFAGGVPAMCDGVTQGQPGMELSLWSRDIIAQATAVALSHGVFDGMLLLGVCDKIVPGLLIGALHFGHLPALLVPAGPMGSGLSNSEKARVRQQHAQGLVDRSALLQAEEASYHGAGTCTFYGTANSNQMLMEVMGLHLPGTAFVQAGTPLRRALTAEAGRLGAALCTDGTPVGEQVDARCIVNAIVGLLATGGSTNHTIHLVAIARAAGLLIDWQDFDELSAVTPLLTRMYPNGSADVNAFHAAGGMAFVIRELLDAGLLHEDVATVVGRGLRAYTRTPQLDGERLVWVDAPAVSGDEQVLRPASQPFQPDGGLRLLQGRLGRAIFKASAVKPEHRRVMAPARVFDDQADVIAAFKAGELDRDVVVVLRFQGPRANGMPELHQLTPSLSVLQDRGYQVALVTDGRMSGASGKVPAALHLSPEALGGGPLSRVRDGDLVCLDAHTGELSVQVDEAPWAARPPAAPGRPLARHGWGRELFAAHRHLARSAEEGAVSWPVPSDDE